MTQHKQAKPKAAKSGPFTYRNWRAFDEGKSPEETHEWPLFSEAWFTGEARDLGPYSVLNAVAMAPRGHARAALVLRGGLCTGSRPEANGKDTYHGAAHQEEVAALLSLCTGVRLRAGGETRWFKEGKDPLGHPRGFGGQVDFVLPEDRVMLPRAVRGFHGTPVALGEGEEFALLRQFPTLDPETAGVLVRSARLYQDALWVAESEPHLAWLFLVSAVETAAHHWRKKNRNHVERLADSMPELVSLLHEEGGDPLVAKVAERIADITGATKTFTDFALTFDPGPPPGHRIKFLAVDWTKLREALRLVYKWRSRALHGGTPIPAPMCFPPIVNGREWAMFKDDPPGAISERPLGLGAGTGEATWSNEETPMLLHVFEHITRGALLRWWRETSPSGREGPRAV
jgi:hypothetical protein